MLTMGGYVLTFLSGGLRESGGSERTAIYDEDRSGSNVYRGPSDQWGPVRVGGGFLWY